MPVEDSSTPLTAVQPRREWVPPDFQELSAAPEITAYSGTWD